MNFVALFVLLFFSLKAAACDQWSVTVGDRAYHADRSKSYNEHNRFVAYHCDQWLVGTLVNSINRRSFLLATQVREPLTENLSLGYTITMITGYSRPNHPHVFPFLGATYTLGALGEFGSHIAIDFNTNYVLSVVGVRYISNPKIPARRSYAPPSGLFALGYSHGFRGSRIEGHFNLSGAYPDLPRGLVLGANIEYGHHSNIDWISGDRIVREQKSSNRGKSLTLAWYPYGNKWLGAYAGVNFENIKYASDYSASSIAKDEAHKRGETTFTASGQKIPLDAHVTETVEWKSRSAPTVGLRLGNPFGGKNRLTAYLDVGASYVKSPTRSLTSSVGNINQGGSDLTAKVAKYRVAPIVQIGVNYKF